MDIWLSQKCNNIQHICLLYARNSVKHFNCFILFNAHDNPIIVSIFQRGLREIKHFIQDASGTKIQSQAWLQIPILNRYIFCWGQRKSTPEVTKEVHKNQMSVLSAPSVKMSDRFTNIPYIIPTPKKQLYHHLRPTAYFNYAR